MKSSQARRALRFVRPHQRAVMLVLLLALLQSACAAAEPLVLMRLVDRLSHADAVRHFPPLALLLGALELTRVLLEKRLEVASWRVRLAVDFDVRDAIIRRLVSLPVSWHEREPVGATMNRVNHAIAGFTNAFGELAFRSLPALVYLVLAVAAMFRLQWHLALVVLVAAPLPAVVGVWAAREQTTRERSLLQQWSALYGRLNQVLAGMRTVTTHGMGSAEADRFRAGTQSANAVVSNGVSRDAKVGGVRAAITTLTRLTALSVGGWLVAQHHLTVGVLMAFLGYIAGLFAPVEGLTTVYQTWRKAAVALDTIGDILDAADPLADPPDAVNRAIMRGAIRFERVSFAYGTRRVLHAVSFTVEPGETVAIVGPSGSGKSTLLSLVARLQLPSAGRVLIDEMDLARLPAVRVRQALALVLQDVHLFDESVAANIAYGVSHATRADIERVARAAALHESIMTMPDGYETLVGERGARLSGGQRQRVAIARALLRDPVVLALDEATSSLDTVAEAAVQRALRELMAGRTTLVVAHRLSTVRNADRIVVMRHGRVEAVGRHEALAKQSATYRQLLRSARGDRLRPLSAP